MYKSDLPGVAAIPDSVAKASYVKVEEQIFTLSFLQMPSWTQSIMPMHTKN